MNVLESVDISYSEAAGRRDLNGQQPLIINVLFVQMNVFSMVRDDL